MRIEGSVLPNTQAANQNVTNNISHEKPKDCISVVFGLLAKTATKRKTGGLPTNNFKISNAAHSLITRNIPVTVK